MPTVKELQELLRAKGLKVSGKKDELLARLGMNKSPKTRSAHKSRYRSGSRSRKIRSRSRAVKRVTFSKSVHIKNISPRAKSPPPKTRSAHKVRSPVKFPTMRHLLIMEKLYENANLVVPTVDKLKIILKKWKKSIKPSLGKEISEKSGGNKYKENYYFRQVAVNNFAGKNKIDDRDVVLAFLIIFDKDLKKALGKELFDRLDAAFSV